MPRLLVLTGMSPAHSEEFSIAVWCVIIIISLSIVVVVQLGRYDSPGDYHGTEMSQSADHNNIMTAIN